LVEFGDALGRVLEKNGRDFTEKDVAAIGIEGAKVVEGLGVKDGRWHGMI
jgi:hypothetical protein